MTGDAGGYPRGVDRPGFWSADRPGAWSADQPGICSDRPGFWRADRLGAWLLDQPGALRRQPPGIWRVDRPGFWSTHRAGVRNALRTALQAAIRTSGGAGAHRHAEPGRPGPPPAGGGSGGGGVGAPWSADQFGEWVIGTGPVSSGDARPGGRGGERSGSRRGVAAGAEGGGAAPVFEGDAPPGGGGGDRPGSRRGAEGVDPVSDVSASGDERPGASGPGSGPMLAGNARSGGQDVDRSGARSVQPPGARSADRPGAGNPGQSFAGSALPSPRGADRSGAWDADPSGVDDPVADRVVVITGASSGLGAAAARRFHALGARVVPVGRSPERTAALAAELGVTGHVVDFSSLATVRALADDLLAKLSRIDVLAANAGGIPDRTGPTVDRVDPVLQVNALGPWLLNALLLPALAGGRIVATSSRAHRGASLAVSEVDGLPVGARPLGAYAAYGRAKLVSGILLRELGRRNPGLPVADFHPGVMATGFARHLGAPGALFTLLARPLLVRPETAADQLVRIASRARATGYHVGDRPAPGSPQLDDPVLGALLWDMAAKATGHP
ncbi:MULTISPECIES: SDR family NAD(P)-dependent oxidoreductase [Actinosynnema]|uniref:SDR family NAD(P)-dependent oxidoreductase n=1 Tax=Actinosynnema TaxID=40566 RepID=UPI0020A33DF0|nr:SDR family NAD(P)-dependent oxidoreductase [Actinosynnema pretiosum]MCP2094880.1 NADP-dependent 3-hydroxy acid dehydrogenase YdfG [Actinosynnema pretiosum]